MLTTLSAAVGISEKRYRSLTEEVFGRLPDDLEIPPVKARKRDILRAVLPMGLHVLGEARATSRCWMPTSPSIRRSVIAARPTLQR